MRKTSKVVVLGGGTGNFTVLSGLKTYCSEIELCAIVSVADDGGSSGVLRDEYGILPPGDIVQCLIALSEASDKTRRLFQYRFARGSLEGHRVGNLMLTGAFESEGDRLQAINLLQDVLKVCGRVIPASVREARLYAELMNGQVLEGEHVIDQDGRNRSPIRRCRLEAPVPANPEAVQAITEADLVVLAPGDMYTSLVPVLLVDGITQALGETHAPIVQVVNLANKPGHTDGFSARRFCEEMNSYLSPNRISIALVNTAKPSPQILQRYGEAGDAIVKDDLHEPAPYRVVRADLISDEIAAQVPGDKLTRSLLRHDAGKLGYQIMKIVRSSC